MNKTKPNLLRTLAVIMAAMLLIAGCSGKAEDTQGAAANNGSKTGQAEQQNTESNTASPKQEEKEEKPEEEEAKTEQPAQGDWHTLVNEEGSLSLSVPKEWAELQLSPVATIQAGKLESEDYAMVVSEPKDTFSGDFTLKEYYERVTENMKGTIQNGTFGEPKEVTVNGRQGIQFELQGEIEKIKIAYVITLVETSNSFNQVLFWTLQNRMDEKRATYLESIDTFKEI